MKRFSRQLLNFKLFASPEESISEESLGEGVFIHYKSTISVPKMKSAFQKYLGEQGDESIKFLDEIELLDSLKGKNLVKKVQHLYYTFIVKNSIQISEEIRNKIEKTILEQVEDPKVSSIWVLDQSASEIFEPAKQFIHQKLEKEQFPEFLESKQCLEVLKQHPEDPRIYFPKEVLAFPFKDENFEDSIISELDIQFLKCIFEKSNQWKTYELKDTRYDTHCFFSSQNFFPHGKNEKVNI
jgi:hypothetical protein